MRLTFISIAAIVLLLLLQVIAQQDELPSLHHDATKAVSAERKQGYHRDAIAFTRQREKANKALYDATVSSVRQAKATFKSTWQEQKHGQATKEGFRMLKQPMKSLSQYAQNRVTNLSTRLKHSAVGQKLTSPIVTEEDLRTKRLDLIEKHAVRSERMAKSINNLHNSARTR